MTVVYVKNNVEKPITQFYQSHWEGVKAGMLSPVNGGLAYLGGAFYQGRKIRNHIGDSIRNGTNFDSKVVGSLFHRAIVPSYSFSVLSLSMLPMALAANRAMKHGDYKDGLPLAAGIYAGSLYANMSYLRSVQYIMTDAGMRIVGKTATLKGMLVAYAATTAIDYVMRNGSNSFRLEKASK